MKIYYKNITVSFLSFQKKIITNMMEQYNSNSFRENLKNIQKKFVSFIMTTKIQKRKLEKNIINLTKKYKIV